MNTKSKRVRPILRGIEFGPEEEKPINEIHTEQELNVRNYPDEKEIQELKDSIELVGQLQPILLSPSNGEYELVDGRQRLEALKALDRPTVRCKISRRPLTPIEAKIVSIHGTTKRKELPKEDMIVACTSLAEQGLKPSQMASNLGVTLSTVNRYLALIMLPPEIRSQVGRGKPLNREDAENVVEAAKGDKKKIIEFVKAILDYRILKDQIKNLPTVAKENPGATTEEIIQKAQGYSVQLLLSLSRELIEGLDEASKRFSFAGRQEAAVGAIREYLTLHKII